MDFLGIGPWELFLILVIALIFLGPGKIVDFSRTLGKWVRAIRKAGNEFTTAVTREVEKIEKEPPPPSREITPGQSQSNTPEKGPEAGPGGKEAPHNK
jgi:Sec-independent protein translocase protein TatA